MDTLETFIRADNGSYVVVDFGPILTQIATADRAEIIKRLDCFNCGTPAGIECKCATLLRRLR